MHARAVGVITLELTAIRAYVCVQYTAMIMYSEIFLIFFFSIFTVLRVTTRYFRVHVRWGAGVGEREREID